MSRSCGPALGMGRPFWGVASGHLLEQLGRGGDGEIADGVIGEVLDGVVVACQGVGPPDGEEAFVVSEYRAGDEIGLVDGQRRDDEVDLVVSEGAELLQPLFGAGEPLHVDHLTAFTAESFGGPTRCTDELGFRHLIEVHRGLRITEDQRQRFVQLYLQALDDVGITADVEALEAIEEHVEFGTQVAVQNSHADTDEQLHPLREVPRWTWAREHDPS